MDFLDAELLRDRRREEYWLRAIFMEQRSEYLHTFYFYPCKRPLRPIGLLDVEDSTFSRHRLTSPPPPSNCIEVPIKSDTTEGRWLTISLLSHVTP
jgi:hypothetical protein